MSLRRLILLPFALSAAAAVLIALFFEIDVTSYLVPTLMVVTLIIVAMFRRVASKWVIILLILLAGLVAGSRATQDLNRAARREWQSHWSTAEPYQFVGQVLLAGSDRISTGTFLMKSIAIKSGDTGWKPCDWIIGVRTDTAKVIPGDVISVSGTPSNERKELAESIPQLLHRVTSGTVGVLRVKAGGVHVIRTSGVSVARQLFVIRAWIAFAYRKTLSPDGAALCTALLLGDQREFSDVFSEKLRVTGLSHIFALSGMNTGLLISLIWLVSGVPILNTGARYGLCIAFSIVYLGLGLMVPSLLRATLMAVIYILSRLWSRKIGLANLISAAAFIELLWKPLHLVSPAFVLSYLSVAGIALSYEYLRSSVLSTGVNRSAGALTPLIDAGMVTLGAQLGTLPATAFFFGQVPLLGLLANVIAVPVFALLLVAASLLIAIYAISATLALPLANGIDWVCAAISKLVLWISEVPFSSLAVSDTTWFAAVVAYAAIILVLFGLRRREHIWIVCGVLLLANSYIWAKVLNPHEEEIRVTFFDVENGDAALITTPGATMLIDCGPRIFDWTPATRVIAELRSLGKDRIDYLMLTHPDNDHIGGAAEIMERIEIGQVLTNGDTAVSRVFFEYQLACQSLQVIVDTVHAGDQVLLHEHAQVTLLSPTKSLRTSEFSENQRSLVALLECNGSNVLFTADIDSLVETSLLSWAEVKDIDILKVSHHGSSSGSCAEFLSATSPDLALISAGDRNIYGHPSPEVMTRLESQTVPYQVTGWTGTVRFVQHESGWTQTSGSAESLALAWSLI